MITRKFLMGFRSRELPGQSGKVNFDFQRNVCIFFKCGMVKCSAEKYHCHLRMIFAWSEPSFFQNFQVFS